MSIDPGRQTNFWNRLANFLLCGVVVCLFAGCGAHSLPPVAERSPVFQKNKSAYVVQDGDTLYSIAWRFDKDFRDLAHLNGISAPYRIVPGQRLLLRGLGLSRPAKVTTRKPPLVAAAPPIPPPSLPRTQKKKPQSTRAWQAGKWVWPAPGNVVRAFGGSNKGIDIQLSSSAVVQAAAPGEVVYAGSGLRGFRHLIILKHDDHYLSAYALNQNLKVQEGQMIKAGARLADIVGRGSAASLLHFEIRKDGDPVNPGRFLKQR